MDDYNIICIDPSLSCTAVVVNDEKAVFTTTSTAYTKTLKLNKWFELCEPFVEVFCHDFEKLQKMSFSDSELSKFLSYDIITDKIVNYIKKKITYRGFTAPSKVYIEGYSFSSSAGPLIDLVTFGTLLRYKLRDTITLDITTIPPSELKLYAAKLTYAPSIEKKKEVWRNREGLSGGKFKKHEMYKALTENTALVCPWVELLREYEQTVMASKSVPKPIEDINDAKLMYEIAKSNKYFITSESDK